MQHTKFFWPGITYIFFTYLWFFQETAAQTANPSMLWRINHPGQNNPSYLYAVPGDNREILFNFPDSLYHALHTTEYFSLVRSPKDILAFTLEALTDEKNIQSVLLSEAVSPNQWPAYAPRLQKKMNKPAESITLWETIEFSNRLKRSFDPASPFRTDAETYLYEYARRLGKPMHGLQRVRTDEGKLFIPISASELQWLTEDAGSAAQKKTTDQFVAAYLSGGLKKMSDICACAQKGDAFHEGELRRVASSIDSMAATKPTFFLVPVGYLLSEKNLLHYLTGKMTATPVPLANRVSYRQKPLPPPLQQSTPVSDRLRNRYRANMPGDYFEKVIGNIMEIFLGIDLYEETSYLVTSYPAMFAPTGQGNLLEETARQFLEVKKLPSPKNITKNGLTGLEYLVKNGQQEKRLQVYRDEEIIFLAMVVRENAAKPQSYGTDFFDELQLLPPAEEKWQTRHIDQHAFSIDAPGPLTYDPVMSKAELQDPRWKLQVYTHNDNKSGMLYMVTVTSATADLYIASDSVYLTDVRKNTLNSLKSVFLDSIFREDGRITFNVQGETQTPGVFATIKSVVRKNELVSPAVVYLEKQRQDARIGRFMESFRFMDKKPTSFQKFTIREGLATTVAPSPFAMHIDTGFGEASALSFNSRDTATTDVYSAILVAAGNKQWYRNAGEYWEEKLAVMAEDGDSLIRQQPVMNGEAEGYQVVLRSKHMDKHIRLLPFADSLLGLVSITRPDEALQPDPQRFFEEFRFLPPYRPPLIFRSRAQELLDNLQSADTSVFAEALVRMDDAPFSIADIPALRKALLNHYPLAAYDKRYAKTPTEKIGRALLKLGDPTIASYAMKEYGQPKGRTWLEQSLLLEMIALQPRENTYRFIADQLISVPPDSLIAEDVFYALCDDPDELYEVFPDLLPLITHPSMQNGMLAVINTMVESDSVKPHVVLPYERQILSVLQKGLENPARESENGFYNSQYRAINLAGRMATPDSEILLRQALQVYQSGLKLRAAMDLVAMNKPPDAPTLEAMAANPDFRYDMYAELQERGRDNLFPAKQARQQLMAESLLWTLAKEEANPLSIKAAGQKNYSLSNRQVIIYFFTIQFVGQDGTPTPRLAMAVFSADKNELLVQGGHYYIHWDEPFESREKEKLMSQMIDWLKE